MRVYNSIFNIANKQDVLVNLGLSFILNILAADTWGGWYMTIKGGDTWADRVCM